VKSQRAWQNAKVSAKEDGKKRRKALTGHNADLIPQDPTRQDEKKKKKRKSKSWVKRRNNRIKGQERDIKKL